MILSNGWDYYVHRGCLVLSGPFIFRNPEFLGNYDTSQIYHWVNSLNAEERCNVFKFEKQKICTLKMG